jgi:hypothetical protein
MKPKIRACRVVPYQRTGANPRAQRHAQDDGGVRAVASAGAQRNCPEGHHVANAPGRFSA